MRQALLRKAAMALAALAVLVAVPAFARTEKRVVHGESLVGNLQGNSPERTVYVILPPSYDRDEQRRYPVLYFLHGRTSTAREYVGLIPFDADLRAMGAGPREMIVVVPDTDTLFGGSMYTNSPTSGNFEDFIARDLVRYVDGHFRTIAKREARGLAGHSMGGYGTLRIGMHHPEEFVALYAMNPCCQLPIGASDPRFEHMSIEQAKADPRALVDFEFATAWSPNPRNPPFYADLSTKDGVPVPSVIAQRAANATVAMAAQYVPALKSMKAIGMDTADGDFVRPDVLAMHAELLKLGIAHRWEDYHGDHMDRLAERFDSVVLPFFAQAFDGAKP
jgi:enterochelin esterase-like enzyme